MAGQVPKPIVQERYERLVALQESISWELNRSLVGSVVEVLVSEGEGRKDVVTQRMSGRARDGRLVHFQPGDLEVRPGDVVIAEVTYAAPHHLVSEGALRAHRRTSAGDAWAASRRPAAAPIPTPTVALGLPSFSRPVT
jgi:tRNA-2-methylthio-N6-dimethylallyladenosine synthase